MQTTKDYIRKLLLETAQKAFFEKGFKSVSMREISKLSGIGLSNIYNYYPCKDDLLVDVLRPLLAAMYRMLEDHNRPENFSLDIFISDEYHRASLQELMGIITRYRSELNLLFFSTQHSRLKDYLEEWIEKSATIGMEYMEKMRRLPKSQLEIFINNTEELVENNEELTVYKELKDSGIIENLQKLTDDKRKDYIKVLNDAVQKRVQERNHNNSNEEPEI